MKLTTAVIFGAFTLGSACTLAEHRYDDYDRDKHAIRAYHKHTAGCSHKAQLRHPISQRHERAFSRWQRGNWRAEHFGRVVHVEPVYRFVDVPVSAHSCAEYDRHQPNYRSHTATVLGAVIGSALGHRIGDAHGDPGAAAVAGGLLGATVGRDVDRRATYRRGLRVEGPCRVSERVESRRELVEYKVTYRYNGRTHHTRMDYHPGEWVKLDVSFTPA